MSTPVSHRPRRVLGLVFFVLFVFSIIQFIGRGPFQPVRMISSAAQLYFAQQIAAGSDLYRDLAWNKTPLSIYIGVWCFKVCRHHLFPAVVLTRFVFWGIFFAGAWPLYLIAKDVFRKSYLAWGAVVLYLNFPFISHHLAGEPDWHIPMMTFGLLSLALAVKGRFSLGGAAASLAFLNWQPGIVFGAVILLAVTFSSPGKRWKDAGRTAAGFALPVTAFLIYFLCRGDLADFIKLAFVSVEKNIAIGFLEEMKRIPKYARMCYSPYAVVIWAAMAGFVLHLLYLVKGGAGMAPKKTHAVLWAASALTLLYSIVDFQHCDDFLPFIPWIAVYAVYPVAVGLGSRVRPAGAVLAATIALGLCLEIAGTLQNPVRVIRDFAARPPYASLENQRGSFEGLLRRYGFEPSDEFVCIETALPCLLTGKKNEDNKYLFFLDGFYTEYIKEHDPDSIRRLFGALEDRRPRFVFLMNNLLERRREHPWAQKLKTILARNYELHREGRLHVYLRRADRAKSPESDVVRSP